MQTYVEAEQYWFDQLYPVLKKFSYLGSEELARIGYATSWHIFKDHDTTHLFHKELVWRKVSRWADWWAGWHEGGRGRPFTSHQCGVGQARSLIARQRKANLRAFKAHVHRQQGMTYRQIAARIGVSIATVHRYLKKSWAYLKRLFHLVSKEAGHRPKRKFYKGTASKETKCNKPMELSTRTCHTGAATSKFPLYGADHGAGDTEMAQ